MRRYPSGLSINQAFSDYLHERFAYETQFAANRFLFGAGYTEHWFSNWDEMNRVLVGAVGDDTPEFWSSVNASIARPIYEQNRIGCGLKDEHVRIFRSLHPRPLMEILLGKFDSEENTQLIGIEPIRPLLERYRAIGPYQCERWPHRDHFNCIPTFSGLHWYSSPQDILNKCCRAKCGTVEGNVCRCEDGSQINHYWGAPCY